MSEYLPRGGSSFDEEDFDDDLFEKQIDFWDWLELNTPKWLEQLEEMRKEGWLNENP